MFRAYQQVVGNKGCAGSDGMGVGELKTYLKTQWTEIKATILSGDYRPQAIMGIEIDKPKGGKRLLGIPTVLDRLIQQAIQQELSKHFDPKFSQFSYGFRKGKNCHQAIHQALNYVNTGSRYVVDIDLSKFFDRVNHDYLMGLLAKEIRDKALLRLIRRYLQAGIMLDGISCKRTEGTPQGSPLSPLLSNIVLNVLDIELSKRGHKFVRYADDFSIYVGTKRSAQRVMRSVTKFARIKTRLAKLDSLLMGRLRYCIWKSWKRLRTRIRNLRRMGVSLHDAINWGLTRKGGWHIANSPILQTTITNTRLITRGYLPMSSILAKYGHV